MRKIITAAVTIAALAVPAVSMANNGGQTTSGPDQSNGHGCFGQWRAGSGQDVKSGLYIDPTTGQPYANLGDVMSQRAQAGTVADHNVTDQALCGF